MEDNYHCSMYRNLYALLFLLFLVSCKSEWNEKNKSEFVSGCINGAVKDMPADKARKYCACMLEKLMAKYPDASDVKYLKSDTALAAMGKACLNQP